MKYFNIDKINKAIIAIRESKINQEHVTSRVVSDLANNYFNKDKFSMVPEQIQSVTLKKLDYVIEKFYPNNLVSSWFIPHAFIEVKSLVGKNIGHIVEQLHDTVIVAMDEWGNSTGTYSAFMVGIKGTKIAFYAYHNLSSLLVDYDIPNYKGFIPLNHDIPYNLFSNLNADYPSKDFLYRSYIAGINFDTDHDSLLDKGVTGIEKIPYPHVFYLEDIRHRKDIHRMFVYITENTANYVS